LGGRSWRIAGPGQGLGGMAKLLNETLASESWLGIVRACNRHPAGWSFPAPPGPSPGSPGLPGFTGAERA